MRITQPFVVKNEGLSSLAVFFTTLQISLTKQLYSSYATCCIGEVPVRIHMAFSGSPPFGSPTDPPTDPPSPKQISTL